MFTLANRAIVEQTLFRKQPHIELSANYMWALSYTSAVGKSGATFGGRELTLSVSNIDAFPAKEARIDRPGSRSEQSQGDTERSQQDVEPGISRSRVRVPELDEGHKPARDRSP